MGLRNQCRLCNFILEKSQEKKKKKEEKRRKKEEKKDIKNKNGSCTKLLNFKEFNFEIGTLLAQQVYLQTGDILFPPLPSLFEKTR